MKKIKIVFSSGKVSDLILLEAEFNSSTEITGRCFATNHTIIVNRSQVAFVELLQK